MKLFYDKNFLLNNAKSRWLYQHVAKALPIIDPHNHIDPSALANNRRFDNLYQVWVQHDPYKHRAMRICGIAEELITGAGSDEEKFAAWAECYPKTVGSPLFHWCAMELNKVFGIRQILSSQTAKSIWEKANKKLAKKGYGALNIVKNLRVEFLCTSDDLLDDLVHHNSLASQPGSLTTLPSLRGDSVLQVEKAWLQRLQETTGIAMVSLASYKAAISDRLNFFDKAGCLLSDHSLDAGFRFVPTDESTAEGIFAKFLSGEKMDERQSVALQSYLLKFLAIEYARRNWKMQLHIGAHRYTSSELRRKLGPAGGYAGIGMTVDVTSLCLFLDEIDKERALPKTILYTLNPSDNAVLATLTGSFVEDGVQGKIQFGPAWWYNDHYEGIRQQLLTLSSYGLLSTSIGFTTDSRSILSFVRHDYYRRILCNLVGDWVKEGRLPEDDDLLSKLIENICYKNIKNWLKK